jgi:D-arabinose 5-phosphate isomerase GutQ
MVSPQLDMKPSSTLPAHRSVKRRRQHASMNTLPSPEEQPVSPVEKTSALDAIPLLDDEQTTYEEREEQDAEAEQSARLLTLATHVLSTEAIALNNLTTLYSTDPTARTSLLQAARTILRAHARHGRAIISGVGKSGYIGQKLTATLKSLGVGACFMHACEAAHGDLGDVSRDGRDVIIFVTFSGRTPELMNLVPHLPRGTDVVALSGSEGGAESCAILRDRRTRLDAHEDPSSEGEKLGQTILLPAPIHEKEESSFGVCAPTTSTTVALAVADMLALTVAEELHRCDRGGASRTKEVFRKNHPGGAIGMMPVPAAAAAAPIAAAAAAAVAVPLVAKACVEAKGGGGKRAREEEDEEGDFGPMELPSPSLSGEDDR